MRRRDRSRAPSRRAGLVRLAFLATALAVLLAPAAAHAHGMRTAFLEITETVPGRAVASLRLPVATDTVSLVPPASCRATTLPSESERVRAWALECDAPLAGATFGVQGLGPAVSEAIVRAELAGGTRATHVLAGSTPAWTLPVARSAAAVFREYAALGVGHIATGADHLLFLLLLVLALRRWRAVLLAESAFTTSHALSFSATALGWVRVSATAAEACIAVSLVLVALDVAKGHAAPRPHATAAMAFVFGLAHGLGFAGGLREIGLPERDVASALAGFAAGIEAGQVVFVLVALAGVALAARAHALVHAARIAAYGAGGVASFWFLQRVVLLLRP
jgi:hypothetical protein